LAHESLHVQQQAQYRLGGASAARAGIMVAWARLNDAGRMSEMRLSMARIAHEAAAGDAQCKARHEEAITKRPWSDGKVMTVGRPSASGRAKPWNGYLLAPATRTAAQSSPHPPLWVPRRPRRPLQRRDHGSRQNDGDSVTNQCSVAIPSVSHLLSGCKIDRRAWRTSRKGPAMNKNGLPNSYP
jgi:hypothetical protein